MYVQVAISCGIDLLLKNVVAKLILIAVQVLLALLLLVSVKSVGSIEWICLTCDSNLKRGRLRYLAVQKQLKCHFL